MMMGIIGNALLLLYWLCKQLYEEYGDDGGHRRRDVGIEYCRTLRLVTVRLVFATWALVPPSFSPCGL